MAVCNVAYKPGTEVLVTDLGDSWMCTIHACTLCSRTGDPYTATYSQKRLKPSVAGAITTEAMLHGFIIDTLSKYEAHELREWLYIDGWWAEDPHASGTDPDKYRL